MSGKNSAHVLDSGSTCHLKEPRSRSKTPVPIEIKALSLQSVSPITVTYNGGLNPELWDVQACLSSVVPQAQDTMTIRHDYNNGGTFDSSLPVAPRLIFVRQNDAAVREINPAPPINFQATGGRWVHNPDPSLQVIRVPPGTITDGNCDGILDPPLPQPAYQQSRGSARELPDLLREPHSLRFPLSRSG